MSDAQTRPQVWRVASHRDLHLCHFEHESVLFDAASGDTHLLSLDAGQLLDILATGPHTLIALANMHPNTLLDTLLHDLAKIDLIHAE